MDHLIFLILTLASVVLVTQIKGHDQGQSVEKLRVSVYYETLCGDSKRFVKRQLYPLLKNGGSEHIDVEFIPYGKATTTRHGSAFTFKCQHGKDECEGNKMHSCAIKYLPQSEQIHFVACSMGKSYPPTSLSSCASEIGMDPATLAKIAACSKTVEGDRLLAAHGDKTHGLRPKLFFVPTVAYDNDGGFDEDKLWQSQNDFLGVVCSELRDAPKFCAKEN